MVEDTFEAFDDQDELEDAAQEEVDQVLSELTAGNNRIIKGGQKTKKALKFYMLSCGILLQRSFEYAWCLDFD